MLACSVKSITVSRDAVIICHVLPGPGRAIASFAKRNQSAVCASSPVVRLQRDPVRQQCQERLGRSAIDRKSSWARNSGIKVDTSTLVSRIIISFSVRTKNMETIERAEWYSPELTFCFCWPNPNHCSFYDQTSLDSIRLCNNQQVSLQFHIDGALHSILIAQVKVSFKSPGWPSRSSSCLIQSIDPRRANSILLVKKLDNESKISRRQECPEV